MDDVKAIANMARETEQTKVYNICMKWLETKRETRDPRIVQSLNYGYICVKRTPRYNVVRDGLQQSCYTAG